VKAGDGGIRRAPPNLSRAIIGATLLLKGDALTQWRAPPQDDAEPQVAGKNSEIRKLPETEFGGHRTAKVLVTRSGNSAVRQGVFPSRLRKGSVFAQSENGSPPPSVPLGPPPPPKGEDLVGAAPLRADIATIAASPIAALPSARSPLFDLPPAEAAVQPLTPAQPEQAANEPAPAYKRLPNLNLRPSQLRTRQRSKFPPSRISCLSRPLRLW
jgi:hypothetical protein